MQRLNTYEHSSSLFLTGTILLANLDYSGLTDYVLKAVLGGAVWMFYKVLSEVISERVKKRKQQSDNKEPEA